MTRLRTHLRPALFALALVGAAAVAAGQELPGSSPFLPAADRANGNPAGARYQLGGIITTGREVMVSITRLSDKQSFWIAVGATVNEVTVIRCDPDRDEATIRAGSEQLTLSLRHAVVQAGNGVAATAAAASSVPAPTPPLPPPVGPPEVQEREARMLVTDLLEIGQQHRKAYEEAQRKAEAEKKK